MERTMPHMIKYKETKKLCIMKKSKIIRIKYDQKEEIANRLSQLDNIALTKVVNYIKQKIPRAFLPIDKENSWLVLDYIPESDYEALINQIEKSGN